MDEPDPVPEFDEFSVLFAQIGAAEPASNLSARIFQQTRSVLFRRRWLHRSQWLAGLAACYLFGLASGWLLKPASMQQLHQPSVAEQTPPREAPEGEKSGSEKTRSEHVKTNVAADALFHSKTSQPNSTVVDKSSHNKTIPSSGKSVIAGNGNIKTPSQALNSSVSQFESLRQAGDRQLFERRDIRRALDFYRRALSRATESELQVKVDRDSWLLISLKNSRLEELKHARPKRA